MMRNRLCPLREEIGSLRDGNADDLFLGASSFEARSTRGVGFLERGAFRSALVIQYTDTLDSAAGRKHTEELIAGLRTKALGDVAVMLAEFHNPYGVVHQVAEWLSKHGDFTPQPVVTIDISCFTKLHIVLLLWCLYRKMENLRVRLIYTEPLAYGSAFGRALSYGVKGTVQVPLKSGAVLGGKAALLAFLGHEETRVERVIEQIEPDDTVLIVGRPGYSPDMLRESERANKRLLRQVDFSAQFHIAAASTRDYVDAAGVLASLIGVFRRRGIVTFYLAPLGTKLQAVGICLLSMCRNAERLVLAYSVPDRYEMKLYSQGIGASYACEFIPEEDAVESTLVEVRNVFYDNPFEICASVVADMNDEVLAEAKRMIWNKYGHVLSDVFCDGKVAGVVMSDGRIVEQVFGREGDWPSVLTGITRRLGRACYFVGREEFDFWREARPDGVG